MKYKYEVNLAGYPEVIVEAIYKMGPMSAAQKLVERNELSVRDFLSNNRRKFFVVVEHDGGMETVHSVAVSDLAEYMRITLPDEPQPDIPKGGSEDLIEKKCDQVKSLLLRKNADYGNSALDPVRIFSKADAEEQIRVRIDDKLSRLAGSGEKNFTEDTVMDLIGYLILLAVKMEESK